MFKELALGACAVAGSITLGAASCQPPLPPTYSPTYSIVSLGEGNTNGDSAVVSAEISADGSTVAFATTSTNVIPGEPGHGIFLRDLETGDVARVSDLLPGVEGALSGISADGRFVTYSVPISIDLGGGTSYQVYDARAGSVVDAVGGRYAPYPGPVVSPDGSTLTVPATSTPSGIRPCYTRPLGSSDPAQQTDCPSGQNGGSVGQTYAVSSNGRFVIYSWFTPDASPGGQMIWDSVTGTSDDLPLPGSHPTAVSDDGRFITGTDLANGIDRGQTVQYDRQTNSTERLPGVHKAIEASRDGKYVAILSEIDQVSGTISRWNTRTNRVDDLVVVNTGEPAAGTCGNLFAPLTDNGSICRKTAESHDSIDTNTVADAYMVR